LHQNEAYAAKWKKDQLELYVLAAEIGKVDKYAECELKTKVRPDIWVDGPGGLHTITQEQYQSLQASRTKAASAADNKLAEERPAEEKPASVPPQTPASTQVEHPGALRLAVSSTPGGADIEVDGSFMGSTPSSIELTPGEHSVIVRKSGYKPWERKLKLSGGNITLAADLERETATQ
jgi:hypothetical protein